MTDAPKLATVNGAVPDREELLVQLAAMTDELARTRRVHEVIRQIAGAAVQVRHEYEVAITRAGYITLTRWREQLKEARANIKRAEQEKAAERVQETDDDKPERKSASTVLVEIAEELYEFGISDTGDTFGVPRSGPLVVQMLRGGKTSLRGQLSREYFRRHGRAAPQQALADALLVVEGIAQECDEQTLYLRVARHAGAGWLDLGDKTGRAVRITGAGWSIEDRPPVFFRRTALTAPLPEPVPGGTLDELWDLLNVTEPDRPLVAAALVAALHPNIPHPVLNLSGEQGSGKSSAARVLVSVLDPSPVPLRKPPRDADSWVTAASSSWVVGLDNLSTMPEWLSDTLCRAVTGEGDIRRKLYTDGDLAVFTFRRWVVITGIDLGALNGDLTERLLAIGLDIIPGDKRMEEETLWPAWDEAHPRILGAVLDLAAGVAGQLPSVRLETKPRMADYARILAAVDKVLDTAGLGRYLAMQGLLATDALTGDLFVTAIGEKVTTTFEGTAAALLDLVTPADDAKWRAPKDWPANARAVTQRLRRQAPVMRKAGWTITDDEGQNKAGTVRWTIAPPEMAGNPDPLDPPTRQGAAATGQAGQAGDGYGPSQEDESAPVGGFDAETWPDGWDAA